MKVFTIKEISEYLKVSQQTIRQKVKQLQKDKLLFVSYDTDGRIRLDVEQVGLLIATYYKSVYNVYCEMFGIQKGVIVIPTKKGTIQRLKRKNGEVFYIRNLPLAYDREGKEIFYKSPKFNTREEAEEEQASLLATRESSARKLETEQSRNENALLEQLKERSFKEYMLEWVNAKDIRNSTKSMYIRSLINYFKIIEDVKLGDLQANILNHWLQLCKKNKHVINCLMLSMFKHLYKMDVLSEQVLKKIEPMKVKAVYKKKPLTDEQVKAVFAYSKGGRYELLLQLLFKSGMRIGEALALTKSDIILSNGKLIAIHVTKTLSWDKLEKIIRVEEPKTESGIRWVYVKDEYLYNLLKKRLKEVDVIVFQGRTSKYLFVESVRYYLNRMSEKLNIKVTPHIARHTYISIALSKGVDLYALVQQVGHKDPTMILKVYGKLIKDQKEVFQKASII